MGEVYRARDTKLDRAVAIKILPEAFAADTERIARFQREAKTLAALNHPNIAHINGLEEANGVRALVMELVDGEDLAQRITSGAIPPVRSSRWTRQERFDKAAWLASGRLRWFVPSGHVGRARKNGQ